MASDTLTPMLRQYLEIKEKHQDAILFFRLGDFYEMFFDDAVVASQILDIALTSRNRNEPNPIPLCGIPYHAASGYIAKLIQKGKKVAICDQVEDPALARGIVRREVTRVITPGLVTELDQLSSKERNYIAALSRQGKVWGLSFLDLLSGEFRFAEGQSPDELTDLLAYLLPQELLIPDSEKEGALVKLLRERFAETLLVPRSGWTYDSSLAERLLKKQFQVLSLAVYGCDQSPVGMSAAGCLLHYVSDNQKTEILPHLRKLEVFEKGSFLWIGEETARNLELEKTVHGDSGRGTLIHVLDETLSPMGGRLLREILRRPLVDLKKINERLDAVGEVKANKALRERLRQQLKPMKDMERLAGKLALQNVGPRDLIMLKESCRLLGPLRQNMLGLKSGLFEDLKKNWNEFEELTRTIEGTLVDEPPLALKEGGLIKRGISEELDELQDLIHGGKQSLIAMESRERERTGINSLKIKYNKIFGYYIEITKTHMDKVPADYERKQTLVNAERYVTPELKEYEVKVLSAEERIGGIEYQIFLDLRERLATYVPDLQVQSQRVALLDLLVSLGEVADKYRYCRPRMTQGKELFIKEGRHPVIEAMSPKDPFFPNDLTMDGDENRFVIITGPNMAGKSTIMRQAALIVLMAQAGSFVPATEATVGLVDRLFTRVGARDDLSRGSSTFMVEMQEAAKILHQATDRSLILLDEIGRGTSTFDGISIAWAMAEEIHDRLRARTLFATHYHELTDLALTRNGIKNFNVAVAVEGDHVLFLRKLVPGGVSRSYGIAVGKMAGLPDCVVARAKEVLMNLEKGELTDTGSPRIAKKKENKDQMGLFQK